MKKLMKHLALLLSLVMIFGLVGCSNGGDKEKNGEKKIAVLLPGSTGYFVATKQGIDAKSKELGVSVEYADAQWDASKQLSQAEDFMAKGVDMIALCGVDSAVSERIVKAANDSDVPIVAFTNSIGSNPTGEFKGLVTYIGQNEEETGALTRKIAKNLLGETGGKAVLIEGVPGTTPQVLRKKGLEKELKDSNIEIVYNQTSNWEKEQALKVTEDLIQKKTDFNVIICQDDNSATGAGQALKDAGLKDKVKVIGLGGSKDGLKAITDGLIDGTTYMSAVEEGGLVIEKASKFLKGEKIEPVTQIKQVEVNKDNISEFKGEW
ncbi:TPA: sugar ABC transporter substrate-binding protein [Clostridioides difficile]|nr:sugar ABC transporter substrate-binding protein [Clostridioides difficile]HBF2451047.1 sugar ABC transporter substrate-binding protein [Clostridioides difficile]HBF6976008.1 sugar ABC transporter substrate-binding protein [Clostridioides difficile]HBG8381555.1 sugar ABC transporter substrate-binding protein [Clostridioides difficile]HDF3822557.1 sugar ABC transporter substrate-binding protein [Clostridioides difficile]